jgi:hypothetical protein
MGDLNDQEARAFQKHGAFFQAISTTQMSKSYKMLVLKAMIAAGSFPGAIALDALASRFSTIAARNPNFTKDVSVPLEAYDQVGRLLVDQPIAAWTEGKGTGGKQYFKFDRGVFSSTVRVATDLLPSFTRLTEEIIDFRIGQYLERGYDQEEKFASNRPSNRALELWSEYTREEIAPLFGASFSPGNWNTGMVLTGHSLVLLMTLEKGNLALGNEYDDKFVDAQTFQWHTQARTSSRSKHGRIISGELSGYDIRLFVRSTKLRQSTAAPFIYCGRLSTVQCSGEKPITVVSRLEAEIPERLHRVFRTDHPSTA